MSGERSENRNGLGEGRRLVDRCCTLKRLLWSDMAFKIYLGVVTLIFLGFPVTAQAAPCDFTTTNPPSSFLFSTWDSTGDNFCDTAIRCDDMSDFAHSVCSTRELHDSGGSNQYRIEVDNVRFDLFVALSSENIQRVTPIGQGTKRPGVRVEVCTDIDEIIQSIEFGIRNRNTSSLESLNVEAVTFDAHNSAGGMHTISSSVEVGTTFGNGDIAGTGVDFYLDSFPSPGSDFAVAFTTLNPSVEYDRIFIGHTFFEATNILACNGASDGDVSFDYRVTLVDEPEILVNDNDAPIGDLSLGFGIVDTGTTATETITIRNTGAGALSVNSITITSGPFSVVADSCSTLSHPPGLPSGQSCTFDVQFSPVASAAFADTVTIQSNDPNESQVEITVTGTGSGVTVLPDIDVTPDPVDFSSVQISQTATRTVSVMNAGNAELVIGTIVFNTSIPAVWATTSDGCSNTTLSVSGGGSDTCTVDVTFTPNLLVQLNNFLSIPSNDPDEDPVTVLLTGIGVPEPVPSIVIDDDSGQTDDLFIDFPGTTADVIRQAHVTIRNDGAATADLTIGAISAIADPFFIIDPSSCSSRTLTPGSDCTFNVEFAPVVFTSIGAYSDTLTIDSNDPDTPTVEVSVTGIVRSAGANNPPDASRLIFPANGQVNLTIPTEFRWRPATDPEAEAVAYDLIVCGDPTLQSCSPVNGAPIVASASQGGGVLLAGTGYGLVVFGIVFAGGLSRRRAAVALLILLLVLTCMLFVSCGGGGSSGTPDVTFTLDDTVLDPATQYYWAVVSDDGLDSTPSTIWTFTTQ